MRIMRRSLMLLVAVMCIFCFSINIVYADDGETAVGFSEDEIFFIKPALLGMNYEQIGQIVKLGEPEDYDEEEWGSGTIRANIDPYSNNVNGNGFFDIGEYRAYCVFQNDQCVRIEAVVSSIINSKVTESRYKDLENAVIETYGAKENISIDDGRCIFSVYCETGSFGMDKIKIIQRYDLTETANADSAEIHMTDEEFKIPFSCSVDVYLIMMDSICSQVIDTNISISDNEIPYNGQLSQVIVSLDGVDLHVIFDADRKLYGVYNEYLVDLTNLDFSKIMETGQGIGKLLSLSYATMAVLESNLDEQALADLENEMDDLGEIMDLGGDGLSEQTNEKELKYGIIEAISRYPSENELALKYIIRAK